MHDLLVALLGLVVGFVAYPYVSALVVGILETRERNEFNAKCAKEDERKQFIDYRVSLGINDERVAVLKDINKVADMLQDRTDNLDTRFQAVAESVNQNTEAFIKSVEIGNESRQLLEAQLTERLNAGSVLLAELQAGLKAVDDRCVVDMNKIVNVITALKESLQRVQNQIDNIPQ